MPELSYKDCENIINGFNCKKDDFPCFVETGSHLGHTINNMVNFFETIHSIELGEYFYKFCLEKFKNNTNVNLSFGDSAFIIKDIIKALSCNCVFFLDGHFSSGGTAKGFKDCPLLEELNCIMDLHKNEAIIIIDDYRLFGTYINEDWSEITKENIKSIIKSRLIKWGTSNDRLIIHLKSYE